jgi:hypothetical protein
MGLAGALRFLGVLLMRAEDILQRAIVDFVRTVAPTCFLFSIPNGGERTASYGQLLKLTGMVAGVPDLCLIAPGGMARFLEVKADKGELSKDQKAVINRFISMQVQYAVVRSIDDVRVALEYWRIPTREVVQ